MKTKFIFPPSTQSDLFNYLKPEQQEFLRPILRVLKKPAQEELCCALLDYLETGKPLAPDDLTLASLFIFVTHTGCLADNSDDPKIIRPLNTNLNLNLNLNANL